MHCDPHLATLTALSCVGTPGAVTPSCGYTMADATDSALAPAALAHDTRYTYPTPTTSPEDTLHIGGDAAGASHTGPLGPGY